MCTLVATADKAFLINRDYALHKSRITVINYYIVFRKLLFISNLILYKIINTPVSSYNYSV